MRTTLSATALSAGTALALAAALLAPTSTAAGRADARAVDLSPPGAAPGGPGAKATWTEANKTGFGTSKTVASNVWYTLQDGRASEIFYPDLSTPSVRSLELVVTDGTTFTDRESTDTKARTVRSDPQSLTFTQVNTAKSGDYRITKRYVTDPARATVMVHVSVTSLTGKPYQVYAVYDPSLGDNGMDDSGRSSGHTLLAHDGNVASALAARPALGATSTGYLGSSDGWTDLAQDHRLDHRYASAGAGNIVQTARLGGVTGLRGHRGSTLALGFGPDAATAGRTAHASLRASYPTTARRYARGWHRYLAGLKPVPASAASLRGQYLGAEMLMAAAEDKRHRGAFVASPTAPWVWGDEVKGLSSPSTVYHAVWARDAYQFGTALWADGDHAAARRMVDWLFDKQQKPDGSFPQNSDVSGTPVWTNLQLDEVALPIVLAHEVGRDGPATYRHVKKAADFIVGYHDDAGHTAPYSPQERWENQGGYSPSTIAAEIAGLVCAARMARQNHDPASAQQWLATADQWQGKVNDWTLTTNGPYSKAPYYLRLTKDGNPDAGTTYSVGDGGPASIDQREVVDPSFLDLVRLGVKKASDPNIESTLPVVDEKLMASTPNGQFWHRYTDDGYGETATGGEWRITDPGTHQTMGRAWPLLAGERGEYAVARGLDGTPYLRAMAASATAGGLLPEQVWDGRAPTNRPAGTPTRSATPLIWSQAQLVRLAWAIQEGHPVETPAVVAQRYAK
ncbi:MAG: glycoside hydrolase family 15 protein [Nocardioidaceae bacterium]